MSSSIWDHYEKIPNTSKATCVLCKKSYSYKTSITNLKKHLNHKHLSAYQNLFNTPQKRVTAEGSASPDYESNHSTPAPDVWSFFEKETGGRARCVVCRASLPHRIKDLKMHLKDNHPKLAQDCDEPSDNDEEQTDAFTEVVYLEDETLKKRKSTKRPSRIAFKSSPPAKRAKKRKSSLSSEEHEKHDDYDDQIKKFSNYVACLLKQVPRDACTRLQMEIIHLIMTTKFKQPSEATDNKMIIDGVPVAIQSVSAVPGAGFIVTVPPAIPTCTTQFKQTISVGETKDDPLNNETRDLPKL